MSAPIDVIEPRLYDGAVADEIVASIGECLADHGRCSLVLAGGRTPSAIYRALARPPRVSEVDWSKVDIYWGDERWVPLDHNQSNFRMTQETLLNHLGSPGPRIHAVDTAKKDAAAAAEAYSREIEKAEGLSGGKMPSFDIVLLGVGEDGHTASIFPNSKLLERADGIAAAVTHPEGGERITLTPPALLSARRIIFMVKGEKKAEIMRRVLEGSESTAVVPARLFCTSEAQVSWFLDTGASLRLERKG